MTQSDADQVTPLPGPSVRTAVDEARKPPGLLVRVQIDVGLSIAGMSAWANGS